MQMSIVGRDSAMGGEFFITAVCKMIVIIIVINNGCQSSPCSQNQNNIYGHEYRRLIMINEIFLAS